MILTLGVTLLLLGAVLGYVACVRADGTSILRVRGAMEMIYPAICLVFLSYGAAFIITGW